MSSDPRVAFVHDALLFQGGAEKVLMAALELYPDAPVYTLVYSPDPFEGTIIHRHKMRTSFIQRLPFALSQHRSYLPLYPLAVERFDLSDYDLILSFSYAAAHGVRTRPDQLHISYTFTPLRQAWQGNSDYLRFKGFLRAPFSWAARMLLHYYRMWDAGAAQRADRLIACSDWIAQCVWNAYERQSKVIHPPVDVDAILPLHPRQDYYLAVSRLEPHKRLDIIIDAFSRLGYPLLIVGSGSMYRQLKRRGSANICLLNRVSDAELRQYYGHAKALVHAAVDDFGIAPVEAQAAGCPVIAYARGGVLETVIPNRTGILYSEQNADALIDAVGRFEQSRSENGNSHLQAETIRQNALRFSKECFLQELSSFIQAEWSARQGRDQGKTSPGGVARNAPG